jgi:hypothetical protein
MILDFFSKENYEVLLIGHSHLVAYERINSEKKKKIIKKNFCEINLLDTKYKNSYLRVNNKINDIKFDNKVKTKIKQCSIILCFFGGNSFLSLGAIKYKKKPFDFASSQFPNFPVNKKYHLLTEDLVEELLTNDYGMPETLACLKAISKFRNKKIFQFESPPTIYSNKYMLKYGRNFKDFFLKNGVNDPFIRCKLWILQSKIIKNFCEKNSINYIKIPDILFKKKYFLQKKYFSEDFAHANSLMAETILTKFFKF